MGLFSTPKKTTVWAVILEENASDAEYNSVSEVMRVFNAKQLFSHVWLVEHDERGPIFDGVSDCCNNANAFVIGVAGKWSFTNRSEGSGAGKQLTSWLNQNHQRLFGKT